MSTSPCCTGYKFPQYTPGGSLKRPNSDKADYFSYEAADVNEPMTKLHLQSPLLNFDTADYFANLPQHTFARSDSASSTAFAKPRLHKNAANSISSLTSDSTVVGDTSSSSADLSMSTDTLIGENSSNSSPTKNRRNMLQLKLNVPRRSFQQPSSSTFPSGVSEPLYEFEEEDKKCVSATTPRFNFANETPKTPTSTYQQPPSLKTSLTAPLSSSATTFAPPTIKKHPTSGDLGRSDYVASIKTEQTRRLHQVPLQENLRGSITGVSPAIRYVSREEIVALLKARRVLDSTHLPSVLIIDIRPFADYMKGHISGALNVCLPSTLLKRANFNFLRCMNSLPTYEKTILQNYMHHYSDESFTGYSMPPILVYDNTNSSSGLLHMCKKLVDGSSWDLKNGPPIYLIDENFSAFTASAPEFIGSGKEDTIDINSLSVKPQSLGAPAVTKPSLSIDTLKRSPVQQRRSHSLTGVPCSSATFQDISTQVSNFKLPQDIPMAKFKIRHNEEMFESLVTPKKEEFGLSTLTSAEMAKLPPWLQAVEKNSCMVTDEFNKLEQCEKNRLNGAFCYSEIKPEISTPGGSSEICPQINCGLDYGHKNRYKDIFLFDHSRVRLTDGARIKSKSQSCDYINASYLNPSNYVGDVVQGEVTQEKVDELKYIATQGPMRETIGDFWKCVINQKCLLIVSLSGEYENGVHKCSPFWKPGVYRSGENIIKVDIESEEIQGNLVIRSFKVSSDAKVFHRVLQLHLCTWADMSSAVDPKDLINLVTIKRHVLDKVRHRPQYHTITHCSAGCGRTGVFCAVDTIVNLSRCNGGSFDFASNPVYPMVNNLRRQRISMVQTMRQYYLIYDTLVHHVLHGAQEWIGDLNIVNDFVSQVNESAFL
ncbi:hypothetical protein CA3LBN_001783 [Candidozyma haemuli]|uniref:protein-tyrosine-phosphatase n=1 Tax=Candidozyma haemuli TaxID=45357 RepID=A0ABX8I4X5_9ASCO|nr:hypothetical protein CA3LBN_001783 [[Candida] haemuloni]